MTINFSKQDNNNDNNINTNKLHIQIKAKRGSNNLSKGMISEDNFGNELNNNTYDSFKSDSINNSAINFTLGIKKDKNGEISTTKKISNIILPTSIEDKKSNNSKFTIENESVSHKKLLNVNMKTNKSKDSRFKSNQFNKETFLSNNS